MTTWDVLIVGAGPAGSSAAYHLAKRGRKVLVLDKAVLPRYKPCGGGVSPEVQDWFDFDFGPAISGTVDRVRYTFGGRDPVELPIGGRRPLWMVRREVFDHFLAKQAVAQGAELRDGCAVEGLRFEGGAWTAETAQGPVAARYVVAADGALGPTAKWLGFAQRKRNVAGAIEVEAPVPPAEPGVLHMDVGGVKNGYLWNFPKADGQSLGIGVFRGRQDKDLKGTLRAYLRDYGLDLDACFQVAHPISIWDGDQALHGRQALLAGEAACVADPFTAEGIRPSMWTGVRAAEALHAALSGDDRALEGYSRAVKAEIGSEMAWARRLAMAFYGAPGLAYRAAVRPGSSHFMAKVLCGDLRYRDVAGRALKKLGLGIFG